MLIFIFFSIKLNESISCIALMPVSHRMSYVQSHCEMLEEQTNATYRSLNIKCSNRIVSV